MIEALVFDVDGVLVHSWLFRDHLVAEHGITPEMTRPFFQGPFLECVRGRAELPQVLAPFLDAWGWTEGTARFIDTWFAVENAPDKAVLDVVRALRARGIPCYTASTQERLRARYLALQMGLADLFDGLFFSCDLGSKKPEPDFYRNVAARIGQAPESLLFFDDHAANVEGARRAGWVAEPYVDLPGLQRDLERHLDSPGS